MPGFGSDMLRLGGPKVFNDGSIQMNTAALLSPYHNRPDYKGSLITPAEEMMETLVQYHCDGFQIAYHGNGDAGIECMIQAMEKAQKICPRSEPRHILIHCQTASDSQIERMQKVGIVPSFFGLHVWYYGDRHRDIYLGPERAARINPSGTAVRLGMKHSLHADTPVLPPLTIRSISTAVNRITYDGKELGPEQRISIEEAVRAYTSHAAWFHFEEKRRGSIEVGKRADFVLLSQDLLAVKPEDILQTEVLMTMVGGRIVYDKR
jgi:predicted amidohydrolase YtcJ